jgi:signal transduction histidine kinase
MPVPFRSQLLASYASATLMLVVGVTGVYQKNLSDRSDERAQHSRLVIRQSLLAQTALLDAETGQRGYLLTGDRSYLAPYQAAVPLVVERVEALDRSVSDNPRQHGHIDVLRAAARQKADELAETIRLRDAGQDPLPVVRTHVGREAMLAARTALAAIIEDEQRLFVERSAQADRSGQLARIIFGVGTAAAFGISLLVTSWIGRGFRDREAVRRALERSKTELEGTNAQLEQQRQRLQEQESLLARRLGEQLDLTRLLNANTVALERSNLDLEQFAYTASHDLKAPLRGIANLSAWIEDDLGDAITPDAHQHLEMMRGRVRRLEGLIDGITAYSRAGRKPGGLERVDVAQLVAESADLLAPPDAVRVVIAPPMPTFLAARVPLQQVFMNLIGNALKYGTPAEGGTVEVSCQQEGAFWAFRVTDHGPGIAPEHHTRIFGIFQTLAARDRVEGTGIGLAIVKKLVERQGGSIRVESDVGQGASFVFTWPREPPNESLITSNV